LKNPRRRKAYREGKKSRGVQNTKTKKTDIKRRRESLKSGQLSFHYHGKTAGEQGLEVPKKASVARPQQVTERD